MKRSVKLYIDDIVEAMKLIQEYVGNLSYDEFSSNLPIQDAVVRRLEIIGEAVKNIPTAFKEKYVNIPWRIIAGARDIFVHEYFGVDVRRVWKIVKEDLPDLEIEVKKIISEVE